MKNKLTLRVVFAFCGPYREKFQFWSGIRSTLFLVVYCRWWEVDFGVLPDRVSALPEECLPIYELFPTSLITNYFKHMAYGMGKGAAQH